MSMPDETGFHLNLVLYFFSAKSTTDYIYVMQDFLPTNMQVYSHGTFPGMYRMSSTGKHRVHVKGEQCLTTVLSTCTRLPPGGQVRAKIRCCIQEILPCFGSFSYLGCGRPLRSNGQPCRRPVAPARRLILDGSTRTKGDHRGACHSRVEAVSYWRFCVLITDGGRSLQAEVWEAGSDLLQAGPLPYSATEFGSLSRIDQTTVIVDRMAQLSKSTTVIDLVGLHVHDPHQSFLWIVEAVASVEADVGTYIPASTVSLRPECSSPEHHIRHSAVRKSAMASDHSVVLGNAGVISFDSPVSEHVTVSSFDEIVSDNCYSSSQGSSMSSLAKSDDSTLCSPPKNLTCTSQSVDSAENKLRQAFLEHLHDSIAKVEIDIASKELDLQHSRDYLQLLKQNLIQLDCM